MTNKKMQSAGWWVIGNAAGGLVGESIVSGVRNRDNQNMETTGKKILQDVAEAHGIGFLTDAALDITDRWEEMNKCPFCNSDLTYSEEYEDYYCWKCEEYIFEKLKN